MQLRSCPLSTYIAFSFVDYWFLTNAECRFKKTKQLSTFLDYKSLHVYFLLGLAYFPLAKRPLNQIKATCSPHARLRIPLFYSFTMLVRIAIPAGKFLNKGFLEVVWNELKGDIEILLMLKGWVEFSNICSKVVNFPCHFLTLLQR